VTVWRLNGNSGADPASVILGNSETKIVAAPGADSLAAADNERRHELLQFQETGPIA